MNPILRFFQDILGWFMEKRKPWQRYTLGVLVSGLIVYFFGWVVYLNTLAVVFWVIGIFFFLLIAYNIFRDRGNEQS